MKSDGYELIDEEYKFDNNLVWRSGDSTPDHMSEIKYFYGDRDKPELLDGTFTMSYAEIDENGKVTGDFADYYGECPEGWGVAGFIDEELPDEDLMWVYKEEFDKYLILQFWSMYGKVSAV